MVADITAAIHKAIAASSPEEGGRWDADRIAKEVIAELRKEIEAERQDSDDERGWQIQFASSPEIVSSAADIAETVKEASERHRAAVVQMISQNQEVAKVVGSALVAIGGAVATGGATVPSILPTVIRAATQIADVLNREKAT